MSISAAGSAPARVVITSGRDESLADWLRELVRHRELVMSLTSRDIRSRYKQSVLGIAWALLQPLAMMVIYTIVFSKIAKVDTGDIPYPLFSYVALLPWTFFSGGVTSGAECLVSNFNLITKIYFPREVFPLSAILGKVVDLGLGVLVLVPLFLFYQVHLGWYVLLAVPILAIQAVLMLGLGFILASVNLFYRDVRHVLPLAMTVWMYATPIVYPLSAVPKAYLRFYMLNPMVGIAESFRRSVLLGKPPMWGYLGVAAVVSVVVLAAGYAIFKRVEPKFAEMI